MTQKKLTNKMALEIAINTIETAEVKGNYSKAEIVEKLNTMIVQLEKKSGSDRKPTAKQAENEGYKALILEHLTSERETVTDIMKAIPEFADFSNQKVAALVKQLLDIHLIEKEVIKGRSYFFKG